MANVLVQDSSLTAIGNAIREKNGSSTTYKPAEMAAAISAIATGGSGFTGITTVISGGSGDRGALNLNIGSTKNSSIFKAPNEVIVTAARVSTSPYSCTYDLSPYIDDNTPFLFAVFIDYGSSSGSATYYPALFTRGLFIDADGEPLCSMSLDSSSRSSGNSLVSTNSRIALTDLYTILPGSFTKLTNGGGTQGYISYADKVLTFTKQSGAAASDRYPSGIIGSLLTLGG